MQSLDALATLVLSAVAASGIAALGQQGRVGSGRSGRLADAQPGRPQHPLFTARPDQYLQRGPAGRELVIQPTGGLNISSITPLVVQGVMYFNSGSQLFALDAATGKEIWTFRAEPAFRGSGRGPVYGDGRIYAFGNSDLYAVDAKTGKPVPSFGKGGVVPIVRDALRLKYPGKYPADFDPTTVGYSMTTPPSYFNGTLYLGMPFSDSLLPGGLVVAVDGLTGKIKWVFNTVPQGPQDDGWEITKDSFSGARYGAGIWVQPAIDPELGLIYVNTGNATPNYDGSSRKGMNLFTNSVLALRLDTGRLAWHFQAIHHDIWDWDLAAGPVLFDTTLDGRDHQGRRLSRQELSCVLFRSRDREAAESDRRNGDADPDRRARRAGVADAADPVHVVRPAAAAVLFDVPDREGPRTGETRTTQLLTPIR